MSVTAISVFRGHFLNCSFSVLPLTYAYTLCLRLPHFHTLARVLHCEDLSFVSLFCCSLCPVPHAILPCPQTSLRTLSLQNNRLTSQGFAALADAVARNVGLEAVHLHGNHFAPADEQLLREALQTNWSVSAFSGTPKPNTALDD